VKTAFCVIVLFQYNKLNTIFISTVMWRPELELNDAELLEVLSRKFAEGKKSDASKVGLILRDSA